MSRQVPRQGPGLCPDCRTHEGTFHAVDCAVANAWLAGYDQGIDDASRERIGQPTIIHHHHYYPNDAPFIMPNPTGGLPPIPTGSPPPYPTTANEPG